MLFLVYAVDDVVGDLVDLLLQCLAPQVHLIADVVKVLVNKVVRVGGQVFDALNACLQRVQLCLAVVVVGKHFVKVELVHLQIDEFLDFFVGWKTAFGYLVGVAAREAFDFVGAALHLAQVIQADRFAARQKHGRLVQVVTVVAVEHIVEFVDFGHFERGRVDVFLVLTRLGKRTLFRRGFIIIQIHFYNQTEQTEIGQ